TDAMAEVAKAHKVAFVDLFRPTKELYAGGKGPFTINGVHLNERGNQEVARIIDAHFAGRQAGRRDPRSLERLRRAVVEKNFYWFRRYGAVDGYAISGGRAALRFVAGQPNRDVMRREMEVLAVMTGTRDRRVWAAARGSNYAVDDSNPPPFVPVETNKPGPLP